MKFGFDIRRLRDIRPITYQAGDNYGNFNFTGAFSGDPFADFLLGLPRDTTLDTLPRNSAGQSVHYEIFAQDAFRVGPRLTLEYGIRSAYHPGYLDTTGNIGNFDPSVPKSGAVIYPTGKQSLLAPPSLASFNACPAPPANGTRALRCSPPGRRICRKACARLQRDWFRDSGLSVPIR